MKKVVYSTYGEADVLKIEDVPVPALKGKDKVLVKVLYSSLNAIDWKNRKGDFRLVTGLFRPKTGQGFDVVGRIVKLPRGYNDYRIGELIVGQLSNHGSYGAFSEYLLLPKSQFITVSDDIEKQQLGGLPMAGTTAWMALIKLGKIKKGSKVLINGGSSGVGHLAIQIAKAYGAEVTSVSSGKNIEFCKSIGADYTVDYLKSDFTQLEEKYDIIFDVVFNSSLKKVKPILASKGVYIGTTPSGTLIKDILLSGGRAKFVAVHPCKEALIDLYRLMQEKKLFVKVDKIFQMNEIVNAHKYVERSRTVGKVIIEVNQLEIALSNMMH